ncbi:MAG: HEAT repeat domain-containing protein [Verrucomicrobia bacterium]|nr:HEAT repeat domain-containing protein [Verrucomicrobiota bacterium]
MSNRLRHLAPESLPVVLQSASHQRPEVREAVMSVLGAVESPEGDVRAALLAGIEDPDYQVQMAALGTVRQLKSDKEFALPAVTAALGRAAFPGMGVQEIVQAHALLTLAEIGGAARDSLPVVRTAAAQGASAFVRVAAARALWRIGRDPTESFPRLKAEFDDYDPHMKWMILECFREMGTNAASAIDQVRAYVAEPDTDMSTDPNFLHPGLEALHAMEGSHRPPAAELQAVPLPPE